MVGGSHLALCRGRMLTPAWTTLSMEGNSISKRCCSGEAGGGRVPEMRATSAPNMVSVLQEGPGPATCSDHHVITVMDGKRPGQADPQGQRVGSWLSGLGEGRGRITDNGDGLPWG